jgi:hypothetical protein
MEQIRALVDKVVKDKHTAEKLKPWCEFRRVERWRLDSTPNPILDVRSRTDNQYCKRYVALLIRH